MPQIAELLPGAEAIDKLEFGCFGREQFRTACAILPGQRNTLLLCGMESHICVMQTALGALQNGYLVHVAVTPSAAAPRELQVGLKRMSAAGAVISSTEMMMYELLRQSGTAQFKERCPSCK